MAAHYNARNGKFTAWAGWTTNVSYYDENLKSGNSLTAVGHTKQSIAVPSGGGWVSCSGMVVDSRVIPKLRTPRWGIEAGIFRWRKQASAN